MVGTMYWPDPWLRLASVLLTNQPALLHCAPREHDSLAARYGTALASAVRAVAAPQSQDPSCS